MRRILQILFLPYFLSAQTWVQLPDFPSTERDDGVGVIINNKAFFGTGLITGWALSGDFNALDLSTNNWSPIASMPTGTERQYASAFKGPNCFYVFAGDGATGLLNNMYRYDLLTNSWSAMASKPGIVLYGASSLEFGDKVILVGGRTLNNVSNDEVWEYTISSNTWLQKNNFPANYGGRWRGASAVYNNKGYLIFGLDANSSFRKEMFSYDPATDVWLKIMDFPASPGRTYSALKAMGDRLVLFAGCDSLGTFYNDLWYYDPVGSLWTQGLQHPSFGRKGGMSCSTHNKFYYSCGINISNQRLKETWMLDLPVGLNEMQVDNSKSESFIVYPNPVKSILYFENKSLVNTGSHEFCIIDLLGRKIKSLLVKDAWGTMDVSGIGSGFYYLNITDNIGNQERKRIVIVD